MITQKALNSVVTARRGTLLCNRRDFIKTTGAGMFSIASAQTIFGDTPSKRVSVAVIGCARTALHKEGFVVDSKGGRGRGFQLMSRFAELPECEVSVLCDVDDMALDLAAQTVKKITGREPRREKDFRKVLDDPTIDAVVVATPDHSHVYIGCAAMRAGKALYLEKPIGVTAGEAEVLAAVQRATGAVFQLGTQRRSSYATQQAVATIHSGQFGKPHWAKAWCMSDRPAIRGVKTAPVPACIGEDGWDLWQCCAPRAPYRTNIVHYNWRFFKGYGTGDLTNNGLHFVDIARWALGAKWPERVYAGGGHLFYEGEDWEWSDTQTLTAQFPDAKYLTWEGCSHSGAMPFMDKWTGCLVYCDECLAFFGPMGESAIYDRRGKKIIKSWAANEADPSAQEGDSRLSDPIRGCDKLHIARFIRCVQEKNPDTAQPIDQAVMSNLLTELGNVSMLIGDAVHVNPETGKLKDPNCAAAKFWTRQYEPGWEVKA